MTTVRARFLTPAALVIAVALPAAAQTKPTVAQFLGPASPLEISSAKKADRVGIKQLKDGKRVRFFKSNGEQIDA